MTQLARTRPRSSSRTARPAPSAEQQASQDFAVPAALGSGAAERATPADWRQRAERLHAATIEFMPHPDFDRLGAEQEILADPPAPRRPRRDLSLDRADIGRGASAYVASLYETELLTPAEEVHLFRKMNFLKHQAWRLREQLDRRRPRGAVVLEIERLLAEAAAVRNQIIAANLRLVVSVAKRYVDAVNAFHDLVSDGNISLMRAVEKFDYGRGFRFSTYATWALRKNFNRALAKRRAELSRYTTSEDEILSLAADTPEGDPHPEQRLLRLRAAVGRVLEQLDPRERKVVSARFGLDEQGQPHTLAAVGLVLGISKERVRQLEARALEKLRTLAQADPITAAEL